MAPATADPNGLGFADVGTFVGSNPNATTSPNWSGYAAETSFSNPQQNSVSAVSGSWVVPTVTGPSTGSSYGSTWVGIDGNANNTVEQIGTSENYVNGQPAYFAWWEMWSSVDKQTAQTIWTMTVNPGDLITASVQYISSGAHAGQFQLSIVDQSRANDSYTKYQTSSQTQSPLAQRESAEWIMERTTINGSYATLPNFGSVFFSDATAVINGVSGAINCPSWQSQAINMSSGGVTYATTSALTDLGSSFEVNYNASAATQVMMGAKLAPGRRSAVSAGVAGPSASDVFDQALTELAAFDQAIAGRSVAVSSHGRSGTTFGDNRLAGVTPTDPDDRVIG